MATSGKKGFDQLCVNRKARRDYTVLEHIEVGIALVGTEVKSLRGGGGSLAGAHAEVDGRELWLHGLTITAYEQGNRFNHETDRVRRLLAHRKEIDRLRAQTEQKGVTLVPLALYLKHRRIKVQLGLCRGKTHGDKRETLKRQDADREAARAMARYRT